MLLTLGLDSQFALMETVTTAILDAFPALRNYKLWVVLAAAVFGYAGGIIFTTNVSLQKKKLYFIFFSRIIIIIIIYVFYSLEKILRKDSLRFIVYSRIVRYSKNVSN